MHLVLTPVPREGNSLRALNVDLIKEELHFQSVVTQQMPFHFFPNHELSISLQVNPVLLGLLASQWRHSRPALCS